MTKAEALAKVRKLLAQTTSSSENEARNAAIVACRLIREYEIAFADESRPKTPQSSPLHWLPVTAEERAQHPTWCDFRYQGCPHLASWTLSSVDRSVTTGHLCSDHVPRVAVKRSGKTKQKSTVTTTPMDLAREASHAMGDAIGRRVADRFGSAAEGLGRELLNAFTRR